VATFSFDVGTQGKVSAALHRAADPIQATLILAHGAGAPRTHPFMTAFATRLALRGIDVVTFNFLYAEAGRRMPDRVEALEACWRAAIATVRSRGGLPTERLYIGGKSMGGRIATHIAAAEEGLVLSGVVLLGYPLHPLGKPKVIRDEILRVKLPMIVVQGTRDELGTASAMKRFLRDLPKARVVAVEGGDHSFEVRRSDLARARAGTPATAERALDPTSRALDQAAEEVALFVASDKPAPRAAARTLTRATPHEKKRRKDI
jgi:uncharacterized protein